MGTADSVHEFNTATWTLDNSFLVQLTDPGETYDIVCPFYVIRHPDGVAVVDTGLSHEMLDDPASYGQHGAAFMEDFLPTIEYEPDHHPERHLETLDLSPADVDYVIMTHLHADHAGQMDLFPDATFLVQQEELRYAHWPIPVQEVFYLPGDFDLLRSDAYDVRPLTGEYDVFGDGSVRTFPTPGHTPGHQSVIVDLDASGPIILGADIAHQQDGLDREHFASFNWDISASVESVRDVQARARKLDAEVFVTHDRNHFATLNEGLS